LYSIIVKTKKQEHLEELRKKEKYVEFRTGKVPKWGQKRETGEMGKKTVMVNRGNYVKFL